MSAVAWFDNDALFKGLLSTGYGWQFIPYIFLLQHGFKVEMPELVVRDQAKDAPAFRDTFDLKVGGYRIEVKSRNVHFTGVKKWPLALIPFFVDTKSKWDAHETQPLAYVFVSQHTGSMVCTDGRSCEKWSVVTRRDRVRDIDEDFYAVDPDDLRTMDRLVEVLKSKVKA